MIAGESIVKNYTTEDLECIADGMNLKYNSKRLSNPMPIDPYVVADKYNLWLAFEYLSPDLTYQGAAVFSDCMIYVWPTNEYREGVMPMPKFFHRNTVLLNRAFCGDVSMPLRRMGYYTFAHECSHFILHPKFFNSIPYYGEYSKNFRDSNGMMKSISVGGMDQRHKDALPLVERQANRAASAFLMPRQAVLSVYEDAFAESRSAYPLLYRPDRSSTIWELAERFGVNYCPMMYRLNELGIIADEFITQFNIRRATAA